MNANESLRESARIYHEKLLGDPSRPGYHFACPCDIGIPGDPNGAFFANGRTHLMYLYRCVSDGFRWGHLSSADLLHWRAHPDALIPDSLDGGIFSGGAFLDDDGTVYLSYWALPNEGGKAGIRIAKSSDYYYENWEKFEELAVEATVCGYTDMVDSNGNVKHIASADPSNIWKKDGKYYMQAGNLVILDLYRKDGFPPEYSGDWTDLFVSSDMKSWEYLHRFYTRNPDYTAENEDNMCPSFFTLPKSKDGGTPSDKYLELFIAHNRGCQYYIGEYDSDADLFIPEKHGRMSFNQSTFFAPEAMLDDKGRQLMWAWLTDNIDDELWSGVFSLPRTLWLREDGNLGIAPIDELKNLRMNGKSSDKITLKNENSEIPVANHEFYEISFSAEVSAGKTGVILASDSDEALKTIIYYDSSEKALVLDTNGGTRRGHPNKEVAPFDLCDERLDMTVYVDKSVIEVFVNDRQALARRIYLNEGEKTVPSLFAENGEAVFYGVKSWEIMPTNLY